MDDPNYYSTIIFSVLADSISVALIFGITGGLVVLVVILLQIDFYLYRRRKSHDTVQPEEIPKKQGRPGVYYGTHNQYQKPQTLLNGQTNNVKLVLWNSSMQTSVFTSEEHAVYQEVKPPHRLAPLEEEEKKTKKKKKKPKPDVSDDVKVDTKGKGKNNKRRITPANSLEEINSTTDDLSHFTTIPPLEGSKKKKKKKYQTLDDESRSVYVIDDEYRRLPPPPPLDESDIAQNNLNTDPADSPV